MAMLAPLFLGGGAAAAGSASLITGLQTASSVVSLVSGLAASSYQASVLNMQANLKDQEAVLARERGQVNAQEQDFDAAAIMADDLVKQASSGLSLSSTSNRRRIRRNQLLARRDTARIVNDAHRESISYMNQAAGLRAESKAARTSGLFNAIGGAIDIRSSMIGGASLSNSLLSNSLNRNARDIAVP